MTKELLSKVLGKDILMTMEYHDKTGINVQYKTLGVWDKFNIHELTHLMKEWASKQKFKVGNTSFGNYSLASYKDVQYTSSYVCFNNWRNIDAKMPETRAENRICGC